MLDRHIHNVGMDELISHQERADRLGWETLRRLEDLGINAEGLHCTLRFHQRTVEYFLSVRVGQEVFIIRIAEVVR